MLRVAVFVSGRGSNLQAVLNSPKLKNLVVVDSVISDKKNCKAFQIAADNSVACFSLGNDKESISYSGLADFLKSRNIDLIVLAGFLKLIPDSVIKEFKNKIINIHPALLPAFGGKGMFGMNVHKAVLNSSVKESGATVHLVDETYDTGQIIAQRKIDISDLNSAEAIAEHVLKIEHELLPFVIEKFATNKILVKNNKVDVLQ
ncbi:phosphoribosylglycinamide formyltransferase [bacterium BMS3Abin03]|nr:phosphoribosylglycinamide formyltransferase [bacterium BMS3Abin03]MCG6959189.1 phosphoribosylglycinamide formyltransferase [bacterium BMS3Abin03]